MENIDATAASDTALPDATPEMGEISPETATESLQEPKTPEGAVDAAFAKLDAEGKSEEISEAPAEEQVEAEAGENPEQEAEQEATEAADEWAEAPSRLSEAAKAAWDKAPPEVRADIHRTIQEMESGIQQYQEAFEPYKSMDEHFKATSQNPDDVFRFYSGKKHILINSL